jgi:uncharacterized protein YggT (Ycf19 family)
MYRDSEFGLAFHDGHIARHPFLLRLAQLVNGLFGVLYALLAIRFVIAYVEAREVPFVAFIHQLTEPFFHPFSGILANGHDPAGHPIAWSIVVAIVAYALLNALVVAILRAIGRPSPPIDD